MNEADQLNVSRDWIVCIVDQRASVNAPDNDDSMSAVLAGLRRMRGLRLQRDYARTLGDEVQVVVDEPRQLVDVIDLAARTGCWLGIGVGPIEVRRYSLLESNGTAFALAREAVERAKNLPWGAAVRGAGRWPDMMEHAVALYLTLVRDRDAQDWKIVDARRSGRTMLDLGGELGVTKSAVSQRLRRLRHGAAEEGRALLRELGELALGQA